MNFYSWLYVFDYHQFHNRALHHFNRYYYVQINKLHNKNANCFFYTNVMSCKVKNENLATHRINSYQYTWRQYHKQWLNSDNNKQLNWLPAIATFMERFAWRSQYKWHPNSGNTPRYDKSTKWTFIGIHYKTSNLLGLNG